MAYVSKAAAYAPAIGDAVTNDVAGDAVLAVTGNVIQGVVVDVTSGADNEVRVLLSNGAETAPA
jgi:hypothetical protein